MYRLPPPASSLNWSLGLIMDVCKEIGLGKPATSAESWSEAEICDRLAVSQIRHWYEQPPGKQSDVIKRFVELVTKEEDFAYQWAEVIKHAASRKGNRAQERQKYFNIKRLSKTAREEFILPALAGMPVISETELETAIVPRLRASESTLNIRSVGKKYSYIALSLVAGLSIVAFTFFAQKSQPELSFGTVFQDVAFCLDSEFDDVPKNRCRSDRRDFTTAHKKINLSFMSVAEIEPGSKFTLQWLRNGEVQLERPRPWRDAFATDLKYASTHIKMEKFDSLPPEWANPGRYHVRFYVNDILVDEARFNVSKEIPDFPLALSLR